PGGCGRGRADDRAESGVPGVRWDGEINSLDGASGGAACGTAGTAPIDGGLTVSSMGGGAARGSGATLGDGVVCALAGGDDDPARTAPRTISQSLTARLLFGTSYVTRAARRSAGFKAVVWL